MSDENLPFIPAPVLTSDARYFIRGVPTGERPFILEAFRAAVGVEADPAAVLEKLRDRFSDQFNENLQAETSADMNKRRAASTVVNFIECYPMEARAFINYIRHTILYERQLAAIDGRNDHTEGRKL